MDLDTMLTEAAPARHIPLDGPDSPAAASLYQRIVAQPPTPARPVRRPRFAVPALVSVAVVVLAAIVALPLTVGSPAHTGPGHPGGPPLQNLAAWSVVKERHGLVQVTIRELRDPVGLWRMLRADRVPAYVRFLPHDFMPSTSTHDLPKICRAPRMSNEANANLQVKIMPIDLSPLAGVAITFRPSAIPPGIGVFLEAWTASPGTSNGPYLSLQVDLVQVSPQCTGKHP
jgi:hypothetical protein